MRTFVIGGCLLLLLLNTAASVEFRRSRAAAAPPASLPEEPARRAERPAACRGVPASVGDATGPPLALALQFVPAAVDLGVVEPSETRTVDVGWLRRRPGVLLVRAIHTGCGCVVATALPPRLEEGASGVLLVEVRAPSVPGPFRHTLRVVTDRPPDDVVRLEVVGYVGSEPVVTPASLVLGRLAPGEAIERRLALRTPPGDEGEVTAALVGVDGECEVVPPCEQGALGWDVIVRVRAPRRDGVAGRVALAFVRGDRTRHEWSLPVTGDVDG
jgi:hypothetical protein